MNFGRGSTFQGDGVLDVWHSFKIYNNLIHAAEAYCEIVPAGTHRLIWRQSEHGAGDVDLGPVTVAAGELTDRVRDAGVLVTLPGWLAPPYRWTLIDSDGRVARRDIGYSSQLGLWWRAWTVN